MKVYALTCSKGRPQCLAMCQHYVERQTKKVTRHIIEEGGDFWTNMQNALKRVPAGDDDVLVMFEDDDWYSPRWVSTCVGVFADGPTVMFGQSVLHNYHVPSGGYQVVKPKQGNCPLHASAFRATKQMLGALMLFAEDRSTHKIDVAAWRLQGPKYTTNRRHVVSMKGMPGTPGFSLAHRRENYRTFDAVRRPLLKEWIGDDIANYQPYFG